jgi:hypothetical protein
MRLWRNSGASFAEQVKALLDSVSKGTVLVKPALCGECSLSVVPFQQPIQCSECHMGLEIVCNGCQFLGISSIRDTQCGFKCFTRYAAALIFPGMHVEGWIFDIEVLLLAGFHSIQVKEIPIGRQEIDGIRMCSLPGTRC